MDFSDFLNQDNLLFILILLAVSGTFVVIFFIIIGAIIKLIKALIKKILKKKEEGRAMEGALTDKGEDISLQVEELEKSKKETAMAGAKEEPTPFAKAPPLQYSQSIKPEETKEKTSEEKEKEKEQEEIEAGLEKLKHPGEVREKKSFLERQAEALHGGGFMSKIKIPVSRKIKIKESTPIKPEETKEKTSEEKEKEKKQEPAAEIVEKKPEEEPRIDKKEVEPSVEIKVQEKEAKQKSAEKKEWPKGARALGDDLIQSRELPDEQAEESPVGRAKSEQQDKEPQAEQEKPAKIRQIQQGVQGFASRIFGKKDKDKTEGKEKESIPFYERPDFVKDKLLGREEEEKKEEQKDIEADLEKIKHPEKSPEKKSFFGEQIKARQEERIGEAPIPPKPEVPAPQQDLREKKEAAEDLPGIQTQRAEQSGSPLKRARSQQISGLQSKEAVQQYRASDSKSEKQQEEVKAEEISLYDKPDFMKDELGVGARQEARREQKLDIPIHEKPDFVKDESGAGAGRKNVKPSEKSALFGDKDEISRIELRHRLRRDADIWRAQKDVRLNLTPGERVQLEKQFFGKIYGGNISKSDVKKNLRRMGKEWAGASNMQKKETLRRQIKFLKNISGIKNPYK